MSKISQLDFFQGLSEKAEVQERLVVLLHRQLFTLKYLKVNTVLCEAVKLEGGVLGLIDASIVLTCRAIASLSGSELDLDNLIRVSQDATIYMYTPVDVDELIAIVKTFRQPRSKKFDFGIERYQTRIDDYMNQIKQQLYDIQDRTEKDSPRK